MKTEPIVFRDDITIKVDGGGCAFTLSERDHKGVQCVMQRTTGTLSPGAHPGSYNGQDAYNDMLVAQNGSKSDRQRTDVQYVNGDHSERLGLYARSASDFNRGGGMT